MISAVVLGVLVVGAGLGAAFSPVIKGWLGGIMAPKKGGG